MKALKPITPRSASSSSRSTSPGTRPPQRQKSTSAAPRAASSLRSNEAPSTVGGDAFSGMSKKHVPPPAAKAAVPVVEPLPLGSAWIVEVHVRIDDAGEDVEAGGVDLRRGVARKPLSDVGDRAVDDPEIGPCNTVWPYHPGSAYENVEGAHCRKEVIVSPMARLERETRGRSRRRARRHRRPRRPRALRLHARVARRGRRDRRRHRSPGSARTTAPR